MTHHHMILILAMLCSPVLFSQTACVWSPLGSGVNGAGPVKALQVFDDGSGTSLFIGGMFGQVGGISGQGVAKWNGATWMPLGGGMPNAGTVFGLAVFDGGGGPKLYAGGGFSTVGGTLFNGGIPAHGLASWDGTSWSVAGLTILVSGSIAYLTAMKVFDDGTGPGLYVGGFFATAGGVPATNIARFDGNTWTPLGTGIQIIPGSDVINALCPFDDGSGPVLYVAGVFSSAGGIPVNNIARWDGSSWSPVGGGISGPFGTMVKAMTTFDDGSGPALYVGGAFTNAGAVPVNGMAKWDGSSWTSIASGVSGVFNMVNGLGVFDDGNGPALYATGNFSTAGGLLVHGIARFDGSSWAALGTGITAPGSGSVFGVYDDGTGAGLYLGGQFSGVGGMTSSPSIARWSCGSSISLSLTQPGGAGAPLHINNANLTPGHEYYNLVSLDLCPAGPGTGPLMGLCAQTLAGVQLLLSELAQPLDHSLFHFTATTSYLNWGPILVPPLTLDALSIDVTGGLIGPSSPVVRLTIQ